MRSPLLVLAGVAVAALLFVSSPSTRSPYVKLHIGPLERALGLDGATTATQEPEPATHPPGWGYVPQRHHDRAVSALMTIHDPAEIQRRRRSVVRTALGSFPRGLPHHWKVVDSRYSALPNVRSVEELTVDLDYGLRSVAYAFYPSAWNGRLLLFHAGHHQDFFVQRKVIRFFLRRRFAVAAFSMPLYGMNNRPTLDMKGTVRQLLFHEQLECLPRPTHYFVEPVARVLDYLERRLHPKSVTMAGISGGGATTFLYSALDARIDQAYAVAGLDPSMWVRKRLGEDIPSTAPAPAIPGCARPHLDGSAPLARAANPLDGLLLASYGRRFVLVLNEFDPCCAPGRGFELYERPVAQRVRELGAGSFDVILDSTTRRHEVSRWAMRQVYADMRSH